MIPITQLIKAIALLIPEVEKITFYIARRVFPQVLEVPER